MFSVHAPPIKIEKPWFVPDYLLVCRRLLRAWPLFSFVGRQLFRAWPLSPIFLATCLPPSWKDARMSFKTLSIKTGSAQCVPFFCRVPFFSPLFLRHGSQ